MNKKTFWWLFAISFIAMLAGFAYAEEIPIQGGKVRITMQDGSVYEADANVWRRVQGVAPTVTPAPAKPAVKPQGNKLRTTVKPKTVKKTTDKVTTTQAAPMVPTSNIVTTPQTLVLSEKVQVVKRHRIGLVGGIGPNDLEWVGNVPYNFEVRQNYGPVGGLQYQYNFGQFNVGAIGLTNRTGLLTIGKDF